MLEKLNEDKMQSKSELPVAQANNKNFGAYAFSCDLDHKSYFSFCAEERIELGRRALYYLQSSNCEKFNIRADHAGRIKGFLAGEHAIVLNAAKKLRTSLPITNDKLESWKKKDATTSTPLLPSANNPFPYAQYYFESYLSSRENHYILTRAIISDYLNTVHPDINFNIGLDRGYRIHGCLSGKDSEVRTASTILRNGFLTMRRDDLVLEQEKPSPLEKQFFTEQENTLLLPPTCRHQDIPTYEPSFRASRKSSFRAFSDWLVDQSPSIFPPRGMW